MDRTVKLLLDKVTQLTTRFNSLTQNSKKIHELGDAVIIGEVFIAVSDGVNTGKVIYEPSEVSKEDFENIAKMSLGNDPTTSNIFLKDSEGNVITTLDISFLNGNNVKLNIDSATQSLQLLNFNDEVVSAVPLSGLQTSQSIKGIFVHTLTTADVAQATITLDLPDTPDVTDDYFLYVNGQFINDDDYLVQANKVIIARSNIEFELVEGMKVTFRYRY